MSEAIQIVHHVPGRIRARIRLIKGDASACDMIGQMTAAIEGIERVETNPLTGSVLVHYDKDDPGIMPRLNQALKDLDTLLSLAAPDSDETGESGGPGAPLHNPILLPLLLGAGGLMLLEHRLLGGLLLMPLWSYVARRRT
jgi:hypothetical protein